jgi:hypothetical protein
VVSRYAFDVNNFLDCFVKCGELKLKSKLNGTVSRAKDGKMKTGANESYEDGLFLHQFFSR